MNHMSWFLTIATMGGLMLPNLGFADEAALLQRISLLEQHVTALQKQLGITEVKSALGKPALPQADQHIQKVVYDANPWLKGLKLKGDLRLRMENFDQPDAPGRFDRNRFRTRLRWGAEKNFGDDWKAGFRIATGARDTSFTDNDTGAGNATDNVGISDDPTSTNQTFTDKFNLKDIFLEQAYAIYNPSFLKGRGPIRNVEWAGGKLELPWKDLSTSMVWDGDVTPEGMYEKMEAGIYEGNGKIQDVQFTGLFGQWILGETGSRHGDQEMYSYSGALDTKVNIGKEKPLAIRNAVNFYDYVDIQDNIAIGSTVLNRGNDVTGTTLLVNDWNIVQFYNELKFPQSRLFGKDIKLFGDWAFNTEGDASRTSATVKHIDERNAYSYGIRLGEAKTKGTWELGYQYFRIERNSVLGLFSESDLGNGHADHRGSKISAGYGITDNLMLNFGAWFVHDLTNETGTGRTNRFQTDLVWKF